jgi:LytS/YehU family sensor histidine kinase
VEIDPKGVRRMIARLSELLRFSLEESSEQEIPMHRELHVLDRYLEIMRIRFQETLVIDVRVDPDVLDALVPALILQPLVENAAKHGVGRTAGASRIEITASRDRDQLVLTVRDTGPGLPAGAAGARDGIGLSNTRARLAQLYGDQARFGLRNADGGGAIAEVRLPFHTGADLHTTGSFRTSAKPA